MTTTNVEIRQLADNNGGTSIAPITVPGAVIYENGESVADKIDTVELTLNNLVGNLSFNSNSNTYNMQGNLSVSGNVTIQGNIIGSTNTLWVPMKIITQASDFNNYKTTGWYIIRSGNNTNFATSAGNHGVLFVCFDLGTPFQIYWGDSSQAKARKRYYTPSTGVWSAWFDF